MIRDTIRSTGKVALARLVLTNREHIVALEARDKGLVGLLLRYPYEVRDASDYFDDIDDVKITKDMLDLAKHIVDQKSGHFKPEKFEDHYEAALVELIKQKQAGRPIPKQTVKTEGNVINLMDALRQSLKGKTTSSAANDDEREVPAPKAKATKPKKRVAGQREMLFPISGKGQGKESKAAPKRAPAKKPARAAKRKAG